ncbi:unnamed protein product [Prunus brigantina]
MKGTATSCIVVGALIVTIMFAVAFTVPGGNNQDKGFPIFLRKKFFRVFLISDSISLFSSTTSVMIFLGILTSRYAEDDFLRVLFCEPVFSLTILEDSGRFVSFRVDVVFTAYILFKFCRLLYIESALSQYLVTARHDHEGFSDDIDSNWSFVYSFSRISKWLDISGVPSNKVVLNMAATVSPIANLQLLNRHNYEDWSFRMKVYLLAEDVWDVVEATTEPPKPEDGEVEFKAWRKNNAKALLTIQTCCGDDNYHLIKGITTAKAAWDTLAANLEPSEEGCENNASSDFDRYEDFISDLEFGFWNSAREFLISEPEAVRSRITQEGDTALHVAVKRAKLQVVKDLVQLMTEEDLEIKDDYGCTAFDYATVIGKIEMAKCLFHKNNKLVSIRSPLNNAIPLINACRRGHWEMVDYLYSLTPFEDLDDRDGAALISQCFLSKHFDIGWDLIRRRPTLATTIDYSGQSPLNALFCMPSALPRIKRIYDMKVTTYRIFELHRHMSKTTIFQAEGWVRTSIFQAVERGLVEFILTICGKNPNLWRITDSKGRTIFHFAIERRQEKVYKLIYLIHEIKRELVVGAVDKLGNTLLDLAVSFSPSILFRCSFTNEKRNRMVQGGGEYNLTSRSS